jgi:head-tail adaptor|tara:strand:+ start:221 stop:562 length:342 start_codon:yes stop_codon:yes gene_type:complete
MIRARKLTKRVQIFESAIAADGVGGNLVSNSLLSTRWASIEDVGSNSYQSEAGITDFTNTIKITVRYDVNLIINPKKHTFRYQSLDYSILDVKNSGNTHVQQVCVCRQIFGLD